jgi:hypothetical protein
VRSSVLFTAFHVLAFTALSPTTHTKSVFLSEQVTTITMSLSRVYRSRPATPENVVSVIRRFAVMRVHTRGVIAGVPLVRPLDNTPTISPALMMPNAQLMGQVTDAA